MKRILHIHQAFILGGVETLVMNIYRHIDRNQIQFDFLITTPQEVYFKTEIKQLGGNIFYIGKKRGIINFVCFMVKLYRFLKVHHYDVIQTHFSATGGLDCLSALWAGVTKRYIISHNSLKIRIWKRPFFQFFIKYFPTNRLAVSRQAGLALYGKLPFQIIKNGIDSKRFCFDEKIRLKIRRELNLQDKFVVGNVSRFSKEKNQSFLIDIFNNIHKKNPFAVLMLVGSGKTEPQIKRKVKKLHLGESVLFLGDRKDCEILYQAMDSFVFPSKGEGFGIVAIEAQCAGLPCFMSDGVPQEAFICNSTQISLTKSAKEWAQIILENTRQFVRRDGSMFVRQAGFDIHDTARQIQEEYLK